MYRKVLIPLDGSPLAERVLSHIHWLITPQQTELILLRIVVPLSPFIPPDAKDGLRDLDARRLRQDAQSYLKQIKGELREMGLNAHMQVLGGDVASAICDVANAQDVDLIAMTRHGRSGIGRWVLGSIVGRVIRTSKQPIFLIHPTTEGPTSGTVQRILVPLDGSELGEKALPKAQDLAKEKGAEIMLVRVVEPPTSLEPALHPESRDAFMSHWKTDAEAYLSEIQEELTKTGVSSSTLVVDGSPAETIVDTVKTEKTDLIIMSTHGHSGLACWVYGCVAEKVLHDATCPLLLIRAMP